MAFCNNKGGIKEVYLFDPSAIDYDVVDNVVTNINFKTMDKKEFTEVVAKWHKYLALYIKDAFDEIIEAAKQLPEGKTSVKEICEMVNKYNVDNPLQFPEGGIVCDSDKEYIVKPDTKEGLRGWKKYVDSCKVDSNECVIPEKEHPVVTSYKEIIESLKELRKDLEGKGYREKYLYSVLKNKCSLGEAVELKQFIEESIKYKEITDSHIKEAWSYYMQGTNEVEIVIGRDGTVKIVSTPLYLKNAVQGIFITCKKKVL